MILTKFKNIFLKRSVRNDNQSILTIDELATEKNVNKSYLGKQIANTLRVKFLDTLDLSIQVLNLPEELIHEIKKNNFIPVYNQNEKQIILVTSYPYKTKVPKQIKINEHTKSSLSLEYKINESWDELIKLRKIIKEYPENIRHALSILIIALKDATKINSYRIEFGEESTKEYFCYTSEGILKGSISSQVITLLEEFFTDNIQGRRFVESLNFVWKDKIKLKITTPLSKESNFSMLISNSFSKIERDEEIHDSTIPHILLVDDDMRFSDLLKRGISNKGFRVTIASSVREAENILFKEQDPINLIISDLHMPTTTGIDLLKNLNARGIIIPVIILSSDDSIDAQLEILKRGAHAIVTKSSDPRILFAWIYRLIGISGNPESQVV